MSLTFRLYISQAYFFKVNYIIDIRASLNKLNEVCPLESEKSPYYTNKVTDKVPKLLGR